MDNNILATVGNIEITKQKMMDLMRSLPQQQAMEVSSVEGRKRLLDEMIAGELFYLDAVEIGLDKDEAFKKIVEEATHNLLQRYAVQKAIENIQIKDDDVKAYYEANKSRFVTEKEVKARHILVSEEDEANKIKEEIESGLDFSEAAKKYSTCPSKNSGGDLGYFSKGKMVQEFEDAAFSLNIGEVSQPVKTQFGYHLIVVDDKKEASEQSYEEVKNQILRMLTQQKQQSVYMERVDVLKEKHSVQVNEEGLK